MQNLKAILLLCVSCGLVGCASLMRPGDPGASGTSSPSAATAAPGSGKPRLPVQQATTRRRRTWKANLPWPG